MSSGCPMSRRRFLAGLGAGAAASAVTLAPGGTALAEAGRSRSAIAYETSFGRMFPNLPAFAEPGDALTEALMDIGRPGGCLDAKDDLAAGPVQLIVDPSLSVNNPNNPNDTAGSTFMGQFFDHDVTFDIGSKLNVPGDPRLSKNGRTPVLDLESVYGSGPIQSAQLYQPRDKAKLRIESGGLFEDLPRTGDGMAIISDPRNDEHMIIAGIQAAFILFHNRVVDTIRSTGDRGAGGLGDFEAARAIVTRHYQWLLVHEFLPHFVGQDMVDDVMRNGLRCYRTDKGAMMPVEFQGAAYRFGHSMVRPSYRANMKGNADGSPFFGFIFDADAEEQDDPDDLVGGHRAPRRFIGWQTFFDFGDGEVKPNKRIDTKLSTPLFNLPLSAIASGDNPVVLPQRTLLRQVTWSMPSGQDCARAMGAPVLSGAADFPELSGYGLGLEHSSPLWHYVLKEAEVMADGLHLGPVGGRIVAETFVGMLQSDPNSYLNARRWKPTLPNRHGVVTGDFTMVDLLTYAGVDPASRGQ